jgi:hypothetical protein
VLGNHRFISIKELGNLVQREPQSLIPQAAFDPAPPILGLVEEEFAGWRLLIVWHRNDLCDQLFTPPPQSLRIRMESLILRQEQRFPGQLDEFLFAVGAAGIEDLGDAPVMVGARGDEVPIHRPVVILAEGEAIGGVVVVGFGEGDEMGGVDEGDVVAGGELDAEAAGGALVIVDGEDLAAEGGRAAGFGGFFREEKSGLTNVDFGFLISKRAKRRASRSRARMAGRSAGAAWVSWRRVCSTTRGIARKGI